MAQLPLPLPLASDATFATFVPAGASAVLRHAEQVALGPSAPLWLWGGHGSGRSHLLQAACRAADAAGRRAMYLPLGLEETADPALLEGLESVECVALDNLEHAIGDLRWETALFTVLDAAQTQERSLLIAAAAPPAACAWRLADLGSRAAAAIVYRLEPLNDRERLDALARHAAHRGLELGEPVSRYLLERVGRDMRTLCGWLDRLDRASLAAQRRLTIPFVRELLQHGVAHGDAS
jgi:DnaA-homolog protein